MSPARNSMWRPPPGPHSVEAGAWPRRRARSPSPPPRLASREVRMAQEPMRYLGVNHVALVARDMAETVDFYCNVLEMPLVKTVEFANGRGQHFFFDCGGGGLIAFFWFPDAPPAAPGIASMHE